MSTQQSRAPTVSPVSERKKRPVSTILWVVLALAVLAVIALYTRIGAVSDRIRNPEVSGAPRPADFPLAFPHVLGIMQTLLVVSFVVEVTVLVLAWRRYPRHPVLLMAIAVTLLFWLDPFVNWAPYAVYNPQLWHLPEDWPWVSLSPTVEPFIVFFGYITFYPGPVFPGHLDSAPDSGAPARRLVCAAPPVAQLGGIDLCHRVRVRRRHRDVPDPDRDLHLLAGDPVRLGLRRQAMAIRADLGVGAHHHGDDPGGCAAVPRRHRPHGGREAGPAGAHIRRQACPGHVRGDVCHPEHRLRRVRRQFHDRQGDEGRHLGGMSLAVPGGQGL